MFKGQQCALNESYDKKSLALSEVLIFGCFKSWATDRSASYPRKMKDSLSLYSWHTASSNLYLARREEELLVCEDNPDPEVKEYSILIMWFYLHSCFINLQ